MPTDRMSGRPPHEQHDHDWAAAGPTTGNLTYRNQTLRYVPVELGFSETVSLRAMFFLWLRAALPSIVVWWIFSLIWSLAAAISMDSSDSTAGFYSLAVPLIGLLVGGALFWLILLAGKITEPIAEWNTVLEDKAPAASSSYAAIYGALGWRRIPVHVSARRIRTEVLTQETVNNRLVVIDGNYTAYVSVFEYGTSLYVGWTMWRHRRGLELIVTFIKDLLGDLLGRTGIEKQMMRTEKPRAMREALHSAVREGVEVAVSGTEVSIASTFGDELPIENTPSHAAPPAPQPQPPAPTA